MHDDDTKMLYDYLKELGGICASHTSATSGMGTDWRDNDPKVEPIVEIFQGTATPTSTWAPRASPRRAERGDRRLPAVRAWSGTPWRLQYKLGFQASSDHISTHISYAIAIAEDHTRAAILDAFKTPALLRRDRQHPARRPQRRAPDGRRVRRRRPGPSSRSWSTARGRSPGSTSSRISSTSTRPSPGPNRVEFEWTDEERDRPAGLSWYYVRAIQDDGELAWGSPFWIRSSGGGRAAGPE